MKKLFIIAILFASAFAFAQQNSNVPQKYALVIGNSQYTGISRLGNPENDANDMEAALKGLGFTVVKVLNGNQEQMETAVLNFTRRLGNSRDTYGFFFYAGHGVQANGENFLIPVNADGISSGTQLRYRALSLQFILDNMSEAGNELNMVVLDACRDNPFGWARGGGRGLSVVSNAPSGSIVMYATGANSIASDGIGRNGLFTSQLLDNLKTKGLSVFEVFDKTMGDVIRLTNGTQHPELSLRYAGATNAYLGERTVVRPSEIFQAGAASVAIGALEIITVTAGTIQISGNAVNQTVELPAWGSLPIEKINAGTYRVVMRYEDGKTEEKTIEVGRSQTVKVEFDYRPAPLPQPAPAKPVRPPSEKNSRNIDPAAYRLNTIGISIGSSFADPLLIASVHGTFSPIRSLFLGLGFDVGMISGIEGTESYYSLYPFTRVGYFLPLNEKFGWHISIGIGYMTGMYTFFKGDIPVDVNVFAADFATGFNLWNMIDISYALRTDFGSANNKLTVGYTYRFGSRK